MLCNLVHSLCSYLHFHPFLTWSEHCDMQTFISIGLRNTEPVAQSLRIRLVHICYDTIYLPAFHLLTLDFRVKNDTYRKEIIDTFKLAFLLFHLLPDGVYALGTSLYVEFQAQSFQFLLDRTNEIANIFVTRSLRFIKLLAYHIIGIMLQILQREVLQFALQLIQS